MLSGVCFPPTCANLAGSLAFVARSLEQDAAGVGILAVCSSTILVPLPSWEYCLWFQVAEPGVWLAGQLAGNVF